VAVLRDIVARFGVEVDDGPLNRLDKKVESGKQRLAAFGQAAMAAGAVAAYGMYRLVDAASDADEALNVLSRTFGRQSAAVVQWSHDTGEAMGRSAYELQDAVGKFGAFLEPQFKGTTTDIAAMSEALTKLSVDLASFYNTSDQEASMRLFSGLSGETEAVRRFGIDISDTSLDDFNKKYGEGSAKGKRVAALTLQEKTLLRYRKILADTVGKQNDAILTAGSWANQLKRTTGRIKDLAVVLGRRLIPFALKLLNAANGLITVFERFALRTDLLKNGLIALSAAGAGYLAFVTAAALKTAGLIGVVAQLTAAVEGFAAIALPIVKWAALFLVVEDFVSFLQGKETVIGHFITEMWGMQDPLKAFRDTAEDVAGHFMNIVASIRVAASMLTGRGIGSGDLMSRLEAFGYTDVDANARRRAAAQESQFAAAVQSGDGGIKRALEFKRQDETNQQAIIRGIKMAREYYTAHPEKATQQAFDSGYSLTAPVAPVASTSSSTKGPTTVTISITESKDPKKTAEQVKAELLKSEADKKAQRVIDSASAALSGRKRQ